MRKYGRDDVEYETWYSAWMKSLAKDYAKQQLEDMLYKNRKTAKCSERSRLAAIDATTSMTSCSQRRAQTGNVVRAIGDELIALNGAIEIHELFPEFAKK